MKPLTRNIVASTLIMGILYCFLYQSVDRTIALQVHTSIGPSWQQFCYYMSLLGTPKLWLGLYFFGFVFFCWSYLRNKFNLLQYRILYLSSSVFLAQLIGTIIKYSVGRARPILFLQNHVYGFHPLTISKAYHSTPSGHTLCIFAFACMASLHFRRFSSLFFLIAIAVGTSRILLSEHYISDVMLGAYVGIIAALVAQQILQKNTYQLGPNI